MQRRSGLRLAVYAIVSLGTGVMAVAILRGVVALGAGRTESPQPVVVLIHSIDVNTILRPDMLRVELRHDAPPGAAVRVQDVLGGVALRPFAAGEPVVRQCVNTSRCGRLAIRGLGCDQVSAARQASCRP